MSIGIHPTEEYLLKLERRGELFYIESLFEDQSSDLVFLWRTGANPVNFATSKTSTLKTTYQILEGATVTAEGTALDLLNRNRSFDDDGLEFTHYLTPTYTGGTTISTSQTGASSSPGQSSSNPAASFTGTLKANTDYVVVISPSASNDINLSALWWET